MILFEIYKIFFVCKLRRYISYYFELKVIISSHKLIFFALFYICIEVVRKNVIKNYLLHNQFILTILYVE